jgi:predicted nucleic acid-binding Zn ribbon protein
MSENRPRALGEILTELMARRGFARVQAASQTEDVWREVAGPLAEQSRVGSARRGVLEVIVASSLLAQEIGFQKAALVQALRARLPDEGIKDLRVRVGRLA